MAGGGIGAGAGADGRRERGIPDALLVGSLAFLLSLTALVWSSTGLAGVLAHGAWPKGVTFSRTPVAMRELIKQPHDLTGAWPETPAAALSGWGLFWGLLIGQVLVLLTLVLFAATTVTRWRAVRGARAAHDARAKEWAGDEALRASLSAEEEPAPRSREDQRPASPRKGERQRPAPPQDTEPSAPPRQREPQPSAPSWDNFPQDEPDRRHEPADHAGDPTPHPTAAHLADPTPTTPPDPPGRAQRTGLLYRRTLTPGEPEAIARDTLLAAEGPAVVVTSNPTLWSDTKDSRAKLGPTLLYDPAQLCDTPDRLRWSPVRGCADRTEATTRAAALLTPLRSPHRADPVADAAQTLLACWLHAAAVDDRNFSHVHRWAAAKGAAHEPVRILRTSTKAASGSAGELESILTAHPERRDEAQDLVKRALGVLSTLHIRNATNPNRTDSLTLESFIDEGGTLYAVGEAIEDPRRSPGAMPLLTALAADVVEHGRRMAARSSTGRLDPPLTLVLDDVAAVAPIPTLPDLLAPATAERTGIPVLALLRSPEQATAHWPKLTEG